MLGDLGGEGLNGGMQRREECVRRGEETISTKFSLEGVERGQRSLDFQSQISAKGR